MHKDLIKRLRYMGRQYAAGQVSRGGGEQKHYLEEAADALEAMQSETARLVEKSNAYIIDNARFSNALEAMQPTPRIDDAVNRFLGWRLPDDFQPDCGVSFTPLTHPNSWPTGTNLLTATQAREMLEYIFAIERPARGKHD